jgi:hypothetical protein
MKASSMNASPSSGQLYQLLFTKRDICKEMSIVVSIPLSISHQYAKPRFDSFRFKLLEGLQKVVIVSTNLKLLIEMRFTDENFLKCPYTSLQKDVGTFVTSRNILSIEVNTYCHE